MLWILIGYMFLFIHRPFEVWPALGTIHLERIYMLGVLLFLLAYPSKRWLPNVQQFAHLGFAVAVFLCWSSTTGHGGRGEEFSDAWRWE